MENLTEQFGKLDVIARSASEYWFPGDKYTGPIGPAGIVVMTSNGGPIPKRKDGGRSQNFLVLSENVPYEFVGTPDGSEPYPTGIVLVTLTDDYEFLDWTPQTKTLGALQSIPWCSDGSMEAACAESIRHTFRWNILYKPGREQPRRERRQATVGIFDADEYRSGGWRTAVEKQYTNYQRLGLSALEYISAGEVTQAHKARANWWRQRGAQAQSGKNNPLIAELAPFISIAEENLQQALAVLTDVDRKSAYDRQLEREGRKASEEKLQEFIRFTLRDKILTPTERNDLLNQAQELGILRERAEELIVEEMRRTGATEGEDPSASVLTERVATTPAAAVGSDSPRLVLGQTSLSLGTLRRGDRRDCKVSIDNRGGGVLAGSIHSSHPAWLSASQSEIDPRRHHQEISVGINTSSADLGKSYVGAVEIRSNGGRESIRVDFSVELETTAVSRYRKQLFWTGMLAGLIFGLFFYSLISASSGAIKITQVAGLVGFVALVVVCAKAGKWSGGIGGFFLASIVQLIMMRTSTRGYSATAWAEIASAFLYFWARPLLIAKLSGDSRKRIWAAASGLSLVATVILLGVVVPVALTTSSPKLSTQQIQTSLSGSWKGAYIENARATSFDLEIKQSGNTFSGSIRESGGGPRKLSAVSGTTDGANVHFVKRYRANGGQISYTGTLQSDGATIRGSWTQGGTSSGQWYITRVRVVSNSSQGLLGRWVAKDGVQFVEFLPGDRCSRTRWDIQGKGSWTTVQGKLRVGKDGSIFCESEQGSEGFYVRNGSDTIALDYGMGGKQELFVRAAAGDSTSITSESASGSPGTEGSNGNLGQSPKVVLTEQGKPLLHLTQSQQSAVSLFLNTHTDMQMTGCETLGYSAGACSKAYSDWNARVLDAKAELQYPYASWGDFNQDGQLDFVVPLFGRTAVNSWGWRKWLLVVFQGTPDGHFNPVVAVEDKWGACFDGMLYHPVRKQIEYWCGSGGGSFYWDGSRYVAKRLVGD